MQDPEPERRGETRFIAWMVKSGVVILFLDKEIYTEWSKALLQSEVELRELNSTLSESPSWYCSWELEKIQWRVSYAFGWHLANVHRPFW